MKTTHRYKNLAAIMAVVWLLGIAAPVAAESLWNEQSPAANMYSDRKARTVGDILTILISETSTATRTGKTSNSKSASANMSASTGLFSQLFRFFKLDSSASAKNADSVATNGTVSNSNTVTARMTAQVVEVKPNGNLVIAGSQTVAQGGEEQKITVNGIVRTEDISGDNTVYSYNVANAQIHIDGKGPIAAKQKQGIITQLLNFFF
ncbi:flagellar basal body L-ring protein FlgH [Azotosporobacter soli]|uniref:flagellar basal body L-ring protein FlgH n=1 Tax=Azotosporobacter soli TaxID=3055040 RepID=UPI0031FE6364